MCPIRRPIGVFMRYLVTILLLLSVALCAPLAVFAQEEPEPAEQEDLTEKKPEPKPKINNLPFNIFGLSGLMVTSSTRTLKPGEFEVGLGGMMEESSEPSYYRREVSFLGTVGIPGGLEFGLRVPYVMTDLLVTARYNNLGVLVRDYETDEVSDIGTVEGMFKWGMIKQYNFLPAFALGVGGMLPTGDYDRGTGDVKNYGLKVMLAMGLEINDLSFTDYAFAIMADGVFVLRDPWIDDQEYEEKSGMVHAGMIFPLHPRNFLELMTEYEGVLMRGTTNDEDTNSVIGSLRFVTNHFNVSAGASYNFKEDKDYDDTLRYLATFSYTYF